MHHSSLSFYSGDSYTTVGFNSKSPVPTDKNPIGVAYPGKRPRFIIPYLNVFFRSNHLWRAWLGKLGLVVAFVLALKAFKVDYLVVQYNQSSVLAFDYAISGNTISGVSSQINDWSPSAGTKPSYAPWNATASLFSVWIGINDLKCVKVQIFWAMALKDHFQCQRTTFPLNDESFRSPRQAVYCGCT